jgi:hypothetical protein
VAEKVRTCEPGHGLNAATGEYVDLIKAGIIDPAKVTRSALQNAASIAALFLTTEAVVADKPEKVGSGDAGGGGDDMGGMDFFGPRDLERGLDDLLATAGPGRCPRLRGPGRRRRRPAPRPRALAGPRGRPPVPPRRTRCSPGGSRTGLRR